VTPERQAGFWAAGSVPWVVVALHRCSY
jgi:hypothetical protein